MKKREQPIPGVTITHSDGRWLPTIRSRESMEQALKGDCKQIGERVRAGAVSHDEHAFLDDLANGRITPGKGLYNTRVKQARRQAVAAFVAKMKRENPKMQMKVILQAARARFGISRTEFFDSLNESSES
jgi:hypothetical protein